MSEKISADHPTFSIDAIMPPEMAANVEQIGVGKATMSVRNTFALAVLAGAFIALGAVFATTVTTGAADQMPGQAVGRVGILPGSHPGDCGRGRAVHRQ
jgi:hypothetical protein